MLDLDPIPTPAGLCDVEGYPLHYSQNKERFWIKGWIAAETPHVTLLYGLLEEGKNFAPHIEQVLKGWKLEEVEVESIGYFESPYPDEKYYCIVAHLKITPELLEGHQRLEFLPHINTFAGYKAHFTIAYIEYDTKIRDEFIHTLSDILVGKKLKIKDGINLGGNK